MKEKRIPWNKDKKNIYSDDTLKKMSETQKNNPKLIKFEKGKEWKYIIRLNIAIGDGQYLREIIILV